MQTSPMVLNPRASSAAHAINNGEVVDDNDNDTGDGDVDGFDDAE